MPAPYVGLIDGRDWLAVTQRQEGQGRLNGARQELAQIVAGTATELNDLLTFYIHSEDNGYQAAELLDRPSVHTSLRAERGWALFPSAGDKSTDNCDPRISAVVDLCQEHRPADVVPQLLIIKYELANRLREQVTLPPALETSCGLGLAVRRSSTCGFDRIGGRTEFVRGDVRHGASLASRVRGVPCCPSLVSRRPHGMAARLARLHHLDFAANPGAGMLDSLTRSWILRVSGLEQVKDVLRA